jgi:hypothetical protein
MEGFSGRIERFVVSKKVEYELEIGDRVKRLSR